MTSTAHRRTLAAYAASITAFVALLALVALGGNAVTPRAAMIDVAVSEAGTAR